MRDSIRVLTGVDGSFEQGACSLIAGPTGSGKSSLLYVLAALLRPTAGEVLAAGQPVSRWTSAHRDRWRRQIGICFQRFELWPELTALENVMVPLLPRRTSLSAARAQAGSALDRVAAANLAARCSGELSAGQQQRVAFARALVTSPAYLLADEPTAHQDDDGASTMLRALTEEAGRGATVVVTSHDRRLTERGGRTWASACHRLKGGRMLPEGQGR
jgi:putative ABC transport system ATP-binding protein